MFLCFSYLRFICFVFFYVFAVFFLHFELSVRVQRIISEMTYYVLTGCKTLLAHSLTVAGCVAFYSGTVPT